MSLKQRLQEDMKQAMKNKEKDRLTLIRLLQADIKNAEIRERGELTEEQLIGVVEKALKQTKESLDFYKQVGTNQSEIEKHELWVKLLTEYLPEPLTEDEVRSLIQEIVDQNGFSGKKDMRHVMPLIMPKVKGRFDSSKVSQLVSEILK